MKVEITLSTEDVIEACRQFIEERGLLNEHRLAWNIECTNGHYAARSLEFTLEQVSDAPTGAPE